MNSITKSTLVHKKATPPQKAAVRRYLATGDHDRNIHLWPGQNFLELEINTHTALRGALIDAVKERAAKVPKLPSIRTGDVSSLTRSKVAPMVNGLFAKSEQAAVMNALERSVVFLTPDNVEPVLESSSWLHTSWVLANMYLLSIGAEALSPQAPSIVGLSEETTCYVSIDYLLDQNPEPLADYLVHEVAHIIHNCKRGAIGLEQTRRREWLLDIDYQMRETFAYCCEAYSRILVLGTTGRQRRELLAEHAGQTMITDASVDQDEYHDILREAVSARNGWKRILARCSGAKGKV